jgi:hypothetical protein
MTTDILTVLVALIGSAGVIGAQLVGQVFGKRGAHHTADDHGNLYLKIGKLEAQLEDCQAELGEVKP